MSNSILSGGDMTLVITPFQTPFHSAGSPFVGAADRTGPEVESIAPKKANLASVRIAFHLRVKVSEWVQVRDRSFTGSFFGADFLSFPIRVQSLRSNSASAAPFWMSNEGFPR